jgi:hypothetical protein
MGVAVALLSLATASAASEYERPVERHVGRWATAPARCPSSMVTDGP